MSERLHILGELTVDEFLRDYWQKKPVLIRNAWPNFQPLFSAQELAGLSLEEEIESRIIEEVSPEGPWRLRKGPFTETDYGQLPASKWTLLLQGVDFWIPEAADLLEHFRFLPSWRIDDLMISYAADGGSVGPHYDQYDVFLLQAEGQREWRLGQWCNEQSPILEGPSIRVLQDFEESERHLLNPGDMLYLPPLLAHYGIAQGECQTYSIGFRAPSATELMQSVFDDALTQDNEDLRYTDSDLQPRQHSAEILPEDSQRLRTAIKQLLKDDDQLADVLGQLMTDSKYPEHTPDKAEPISWGEFLALTEPEPIITRSEFVRFAFYRQNATLAFFAAGQRWLLPKTSTKLVEALCESRHLSTNDLISLANTPELQDFLLQLWQQQWLYCEEPES